MLTDLFEEVRVFLGFSFLYKIYKMCIMICKLYIEEVIFDDYLDFFIFKIL